MAERNASLGYFGLKKETVKGTAVIPNDYVPLYEEKITTDGKYQELKPIVGNIFTRYQILRGQRSHTGEVTVMAEPNTLAKILDMILTKGAPSGVGPYTHPFTLSTTNPASYTVDISVGHQVYRYMGVEASELSPSFEDNEMRATFKISALKAFDMREVSSATGSGPTTIVFKTDYDPSPTTGLVVGDIVQVMKAAGTTVNATVASIVDGTSITVTEDLSLVAAGDIFYLRPATPSFTLKTPFQWSRTEFRYGATAAAALSATHTPVEKGSGWKLLHPFEKDEGADRSGSYDPAALVRSAEGADVELNAKIFFDTPNDFNRFNAITKRAVVIRSFAEGTTYELRITCNNIRIMEGARPNIKSGEVIYYEPKYALVYDASDAQGFDITVINNLATI